MAAPNPRPMLATAILWMVDEKLPCLSWFILFDMKYERFKEWLNFGFVEAK
jgi:hypothetical protein